MKSSLRVVSYVRDLSVADDKFSAFDRMIRDSEGNADAVLVSAPNILGDTFDELVMNLGKLARADLMLMIAPPRH